MRLDQFKRLLHLAWPLYIALLTGMLMGVADTVMAGRYGTRDMAAVAIGTSVANPIMFFLQGVAMALIPLISGYQSRREMTQIQTTVLHGVIILVSLGISAVGFIVVLPNILDLFGVTEDIYPIVYDYLVYLLFAMPALALYQALRQTCEGLSLTRPSMIIVGIGLVVNIPANAIFIYGWGPIPEMGGAGCGLATMLVWCAMAIATLWYSMFSTTMHKYELFRHKHNINLASFMSILKIGLPVAFTLLTEVTLFAIIALLLAPMGATQVAAHQIALNFSSLVFMFPLSIGMAAAIRIGYEYGRKEYASCRLTIQVAMMMTTAVAVVTASFTILTAKPIAQLYSTESEVIVLAVSVLFLGALFQISDAIGVVLANALRGYADTQWLFGLSLFSYWVVGLPLGYLLALTDTLRPAMGVHGFWIGIIVGLTTGAVCFYGRIHYLHRTRLQSYSM
ncbi:MAG: MATE family efflux transporter [Glaciecola sp.]